LQNRKKIFIVGIIIAILIVIFLSPFASSKPDGLERVAQDIGFEEKATHYLSKFYKFLDDYQVSGIANEKISTVLAGLIGILLTIIISYAFLKIISRAPKKE
jgi:cobalt/nickel transport protein